MPRRPGSGSPQRQRPACRPSGRPPPWEKYLVPLASAGALADDLLHTVGVYLDCARRRDVTGARLHLHPNTVTYREGRFVHFTGADLDDPTTLAEIWWLRRHLAAQQERPGTPP